MNLADPVRCTIADAPAMLNRVVRWRRSRYPATNEKGGNMASIPCLAHSDRPSVTGVMIDGDGDTVDGPTKGLSLERKQVTQMRGRA